MEEVSGVKTKEMIKGHLYCEGDVLFTEEQAKYINEDCEYEWDYIYYDPYIFEMGDDHYVIVQFELTLAEVVRYKAGIITSLAMTKDEEFIEALVELEVMKEREVTNGN